VECANVVDLMGASRLSRILTLARQKSALKRWKRVFRVSTLSTLLFTTTSTTIARILLVPISGNKTLGKEFNLFIKLIGFKASYFREKLIIII